MSILNMVSIEGILVLGYLTSPIPIHLINSKFKSTPKLYPIKNNFEYFLKKIFEPKSDESSNKNFRFDDYEELNCSRFVPMSLLNKVR